MGIHVSIGISPRESLADWMSFVSELEREGAERIWLIDSQLAMKDVYIGLATAALRTDRLELGTGVTNMLTRHPTVTANSISAVAELSGGRAILGLGAGDSAVYGLGKSPSKMAEVEQALVFFRSVLSGGEGSWEGRSFKLPHESPPVKLYLAVTQEKMCRLAGRLADGAIIMGPAQKDIVARQVEWVRAGMEEMGRDPSDVDLSYVATLSVGDDEKAVNDVSSWATGQARLLAGRTDVPESLLEYAGEFQYAKETYDYGEHLSTRATHKGAISDELIRVLAIAGSASQCASRLSELKATGIDRFIFPLMGTGRLERLRQLRDEVLSAVAGA
jgi:5,10-methylenetetrahydromethanopterin reductase